MDEYRLACHGRFVYLCLSFEHGTVDREARPRAHMKAIAQTQLVEAHLYFGAIGTHDPHRIDSHEQAVLQSYARACIHVVLHELGDVQQEHDIARRREFALDDGSGDSHGIENFHRDFARKQRVQAAYEVENRLCKRNRRCQRRGQQIALDKANSHHSGKLNCKPVVLECHIRFGIAGDSRQVAGIERADGAKHTCAHGVSGSVFHQNDPVGRVYFCIRHAAYSPQVRGNAVA